MKRILYFLPFFLIFNCQKKEIIIENKPTEKIEVDSIAHRIEGLPNDEFREKVLPTLQHDSDKKKLLNILKNLDEKKISFCEYVEMEYKFDDSCYAVAKNKFPKPSMQKSFTNYHDKIFGKGHLALVKKYNLTEKDADLLTTIYAFDSNSRNLCGEF
ncbi:hypothetical protein IV494_06690 [Kaistella sp. G5-32]|uniref:Uncharacterized protein n=1 Tax=Kaistella gelatinilytica TaxID=2787636 RepID=A0ABS0FAX0_9FLAO|nr:hypothetical protein [Kaistella gelatinilytica]MBF8456867.1 hypothetical protein [Kaistella gelatinilytica]